MESLTSRTQSQCAIKNMVLYCKPKGPNPNRPLSQSDDNADFYGGRVNREEGMAQMTRDEHTHTHTHVSSPASLPLAMDKGVFGSSSPTPLLDWLGLPSFVGRAFGHMPPNWARGTLSSVAPLKFSKGRATVPVYSRGGF